MPEEIICDQQMKNGRKRKPVSVVLPMLLCVLATLGMHSPKLNAAESLHHIVVILDGSGSMSGSMPGSRETKMVFAKRAVSTVMGQVPADYRVGLLVFGGGAPKGGWAYPVAAYQAQKFNAAIRPIKPSGQTPLGAYLKTGADALLQAREKQGGYGTYRLLVLTDGEASDQKLVDRYLPDIVRRGLIVDVIGVDMSKDLALARNVHQYRRANDAESLQAALQEAFAEVGASQGDGQDDGNQDESAFDVIAPLPDDWASEAIQALTTPANGPIAAAQFPAAGSAVAAGGTTIPGQTLNNDIEGLLQRFGAFAPVAIFGLLFIFGVLTRIGRR